MQNHNHGMSSMSLRRSAIGLALLGVCAWAGSLPAQGQSKIVYAWANFAGMPGGVGNADGTGSTARFNNPSGAAVDTNGNVYVADTINGSIRKVTPAGIVTTIAGSTGSSGSTDGTNNAARFTNPTGIAIDNAGNLYVADYDGETIRKITPVGTNWVVTTIAGSANSYGYTDGTNSAARFHYPTGVAVDTNGNVYVADGYNYTIRKIKPVGTNWVVTTIAGSVGTSGSNDGTNTAAQFNFLSGTPACLAVDRAGNVYVGDNFNDIIRKLTPVGTNWVVTTIAGLAGYSASADGTNSSARFRVPSGVAVDASGNIYVADTDNNTIRKMTPAGTNWVVTTLAGIVGNAGNHDGTNTTAQFFLPRGLTVDISGNVYVADTYNCTVRKMTPVGLNWVVTTLAGNAINIGSTDGTGSAARFYWPLGVAVDNAGILYVADTGNNTIRKVTPAGVVTILAGSEGNYGSVDGTNNAAQFDQPSGVAVDSAGNLYVTDYNNETIRKITPAGTNWVVTTLAGKARQTGSADGTGTNAQFNGPAGITVDGAHNVYVVDALNDTIRKVTPAGVVTTLAGSAGNSAAIDGTNSAARFSYPQGIAVDGAGNLYVTDYEDATIRKITPVGTNWVVTTIAGAAWSDGSTDGTNTAAQFEGPISVAVDSAGNLYIADTLNATIRKITLAGTNWVVTTIGGLAGVASSADGIGAAARFSSPEGIAVNQVGTLYVADAANNRISQGTPINLTAFYLQDTPGNVTQWMLNGAGTLQQSATVGALGAWRMKALGDMTGDGQADMFWQTASGDVVAWCSQSGGGYQGQGLGDFGAWELRAVADVDGDGIADLILQHTSGWVVVWYMNTNGTPKGSAGLGNLGVWKLKGAGDVNGDGKADLFWQSPMGDVVVWMSQAGGGYQGQGVGNLGAWELRAVADVDGDGKADLIWQNPGGWIVVWYLNANGTPRAGVGLGNVGAAKIMAVD